MKRLRWLNWVIEWIGFDLLSTVFYFLYDDLVLALLTALSLWLLYRFYILKKWWAMRRYIYNKKLMDHWVNALVVQTSVTPSLYEATENVMVQMDDELQKLVQIDEEKAIIASLEPLIYYFNHPHYMIFHRLLEMYHTQGGHLVSMTRQILMNLSQDKQDFYRYLRTSHKRLQELLTGWIFASLSLVYLKLLLPTFYMAQLTGGAFKIAIVINFMLLEYSLYLFFKQYRPLNVEQGWEVE